jgi:hypothetical protein
MPPVLVEVDPLAVCDAVSPELVALEESSVFVAEEPVAALVAPAVMVTPSELKYPLPKVVVYAATAVPVVGIISVQTVEIVPIEQITVSRLLKRR